MDTIRRSAAFTALAAVLVAGACGGEAPPGEEGGGMEAADTAAGGAMTVPPTDVTLSPKNESGVSGEATAVHSADSVTVELTVQGLEAGTSYPAHIHEGTCETGGGVAVGLESVTAGEGMTGSSTSTVPASALSPDQDHFIQVHGADGAPIACGDLPGHGAEESMGS